MQPTQHLAAGLGWAPASRAHAQGLPWAGCLGLGTRWRLGWAEAAGTKQHCVGWALRGGLGLALQPLRGQCPQRAPGPPRGAAREKGLCSQPALFLLARPGPCPSVSSPCAGVTLPSHTPGGVLGCTPWLGLWGQSPSPGGCAGLAGAGPQVWPPQLDLLWLCPPARPRVDGRFRARWLWVWAAERGRGSGLHGDPRAPLPPTPGQAGLGSLGGPGREEGSLNTRPRGLGDVAGPGDVGLPPGRVPWVVCSTGRPAGNVPL